MADRGTTMTDDRIRVLMRRLEETYNEALQRAIKNNEKAITKYASLTDEALEGLDDEAKKLKREAFAREVHRTKALQEKIAAEIANAGKTAAQIIQGEMSGIYGLNYDFTAYSIQRQAGITLDFTIYDRNQLAVLTQRQQSPFTKIAYNNLGKDTAIVRRLQDQLIQATLNGESQQKIIRRIKGVTGQSTRQAKRVAQTERNRVQSQGRAQAMHEAAEMGLGVEKQWIARLFNTRESHEKTHLEIVDENNSFSNGLEYPGDPNGAAKNVIGCFCVVKPRVKSVSAALVRHREKFGQMSFADYQTKRLATTGENGIMEWQGLNYSSSYTKKQAIAHLDQKYGIKLKDSRKYPIDQGLLNDCVGWMDSFSDQYDGFTNSSFARLPLIECVAPTKMKNAVGSYSYYSSGKAVGLSLNGMYHADTAFFKNYVDNCVKIKWYPANATIHKTFVHEYGHHVSNAMRGIMGDRNWQSVFLEECLDEFKKIEPTVTGRNDMKEFVSDYATTADSELFAEAFAEYFGGERPRDFARIFGNKLDKLLRGVK